MKIFHINKITKFFISFYENHPKSFVLENIIFDVEDISQINDNILEKLKKYSKDKNEFKFCEALLQKELLWNDIDDPPFKREFPLSLNRFFPYSESE